MQDSPQGANVARAMQDYVKRLDPTRPVTYAAPEGDNFCGINGVIEVRGWNYHPGPDMDNYHAEHPNQPNVGTEQASTISTRGIYEKDPVRGYVSRLRRNLQPLDADRGNLVGLVRRPSVVERRICVDRI